MFQRVAQLCQAVNHMPSRIFLGLLFNNLLWSLHPLLSKIVLAEVPPILGAWARYAMAWFTFVLVWMGLRIFKPALLESERLPHSACGWRLALFIGAMTFCFSPMTQMSGLAHSNAIDNSIIIAMEPLVTVVLAWLFLGEKLSRARTFAFIAAFTGFLLLSAGSGGSGLLDWHGVGNLILLASLFGEATFSVGGRPLMREATPLASVMVTMTLGVFILTLVTLAWVGPSGFAQLGQMSLKGFGAVLWLGAIGTALGYFYWNLALSHAPVATLAITLFVQPVFGSFWGYLWLGERLNPIQCGGAGLILISVAYDAYVSTR